VLTCIANASQAANNLVNAITLVNPETDSVQTNERVQECLGKAKLCRKPIVRYTQLVENEELIGTLIDTNERIIAALEMYDKVFLLSLFPNLSGLTHSPSCPQLPRSIPPK
jgi:LAS seventeen-binding protein 5